jgi:GH25 family lysozyme M1 (1,4-beta-N-acetylmuramidase)
MIGCDEVIKTYDYNDNTKLSEHFSVGEFRCKCGRSHEFKVDDSLVSNLEKLFSKLDCSKIIVTSGYRCVQHDKNVGGSGSGQHVEGTAADICCYGQDGKPIDSRLVCCEAQDIGFKGIANINMTYQYTHVDMRANGKWYGDEVVNYSTVTDDFYKYFNIERDSDGEKDDDMSGVLNGIDISYCQTKVDWSKVTSDFVIARAGYGKVASQKDNMFESHYAGAKSRGIPIGAYWYSYATSEAEAEQEADVCLEILKGKQLEYPVFYDVEEKRQFDLGKEKVSAIIRAFLSKVEAAGYWVGLYMSASPLKDFVEDDIRNRYAIWVANTGVSKPSYSGAYGVWQYKVGSAPGVTGDVDLDYCYVDYPTQIKANGLNGFGNDAPTKPENPVEPVKDTMDVTIEYNGKTFKGTLTCS